jgi:hypothetical protein
VQVLFWEALVLLLVPVVLWQFPRQEQEMKEGSQVLWFFNHNQNGNAYNNFRSIPCAHQVFGHHIIILWASNAMLVAT